MYILTATKHNRNVSNKNNRNSSSKNNDNNYNKTKVLSVQLGKALGLTSLSYKYGHLSSSVLPRASRFQEANHQAGGRGVVKTLGFSTLTYMKSAYQILTSCYA